MNYVSPLEVFDGLMVSDGGLWRGRGRQAVNFAIALSDQRRARITDEQFLAYLSLVKGYLAELGVESLTGHPKVFAGFYKSGKPYKKCYLGTRSSPFLQQQLRRWYTCPAGPLKRKVVPRDFDLTQVSLAFWFMGDGTSTRYNHTIQVVLCTAGFRPADIEALEPQLHKFGLQTSHRTYQNGSVDIRIIGDTDKFMRLVDPFVVSPYRYKVKYRHELEVLV